MAFIETCQGKKLPFWLKLAASAVGLLLIAFAMMRLIKGYPLGNTVFQVIIGALTFYMAGTERRVLIDEEGVLNETCHWGQKRRKRIPWSSVTDADFISKNGKLYLVMKGDKKLQPLTFTEDKSDEVKNLVRKHLPAEILTGGES